MIDELARRIRGAGLGVTIEELEDILWLAERLPGPSQSEAAAATGEASADEGAKKRADAAKRKTQEAAKRAADVDEAAQIDRKATKKEGATPLFSAKLSGTFSASTLRVPGVAANDPLADLRRALQPFARRVPSGWRTTLDEDETATRAASTGVWYPVYEPMRERWFDLRVVLESSPSIQLWSDTLAEFVRLLHNQGGFKSVTTYRWNDARGEHVTSADGRRTYALSQLIDRDRPQLVLLVTDGTSARWRSGAAQALLCELGCLAAVSIVQLLPRRAWRHTAVGDPELSLFCERAGESNTHMKMLTPWWLDEADLNGSVSVPVIGLDAVTIRQWARTMTARGGAVVPGVLVARPKASTLKSGAVVSAASTSADGPAARVARYRGMVSSGAYDLAVFLSVPDPLTIPVMRLVQRTMLPDTSTSELAEFFVGGLIERTADEPATDDGVREPSYRLVKGVREELTKSLRYSEEGQIKAQLRSIGRYLEEEAQSEKSFEAYFPSPTGKHRLTEWSLPFANLSREVLRRQVVGEPLIAESSHESPEQASPQKQAASAADGAYVSSLDDMQAQLASISALLGELATNSMIHNKGLTTKENAAWLGRLAAEGNFLYRKLVVDYIGRSATADALKKAEYLQISARPDSVVPLEFVYEYPPPKKGAPVCENAAQALREGKCPASCVPKKSPADRVCPMGFWGLSRVIERHVQDPRLGAPALIRGTESIAERMTLEARASGLLAISERVRGADQKKLVERIKQHWKGGVVVAQSWDAWRDAVAQTQPGLFVVLPYMKGKGAEIAMEIHGDALESRYIERSYVYPEGATGGPPIVMLFGSTADRDAYASNIALFRQAGAAIVVGTTAPLNRGEDSARAAGQIVEVFGDAVTATPQRFGEILRTAKRRLVADGQLIAMGLVAFGDADWAVRQSAEQEVARGRKNDRRETHGKTAVEGDAAHEQVAEQMQEAIFPPHETASVAMTGDLEVEILPASEGESLLLTYRDQNGTHHILIDCGSASTGTSLKERLTALPTEGFLDLLVLTNIDQDRIGGAMSVLQDRQVTYGDIWFNGWQQTREYL